MYELWPPDSYPTITAPTPTVTGCTRNSTVDGLSTFTAQNPAVAATTQRLVRPIFVKGQGGVLRWSVTTTPFTVNLLTENQASIETNTTGFFSYQAPTLTRELGGTHGGYALKCVTTAAGVNEVYVTGGLGDNGRFHAATAGTTYTYMHQAWTTVGSRTVAARLTFWDAAFGALTDNASTAANPGAGAVQTITATAPANTAYLTVMPLIGSGSVSDAIWFDKFGLWRGSAGTWALPSGQILDAGVSMDVQAQVIFLDDDDAQVDRWTGPAMTTDTGIVLSGRLSVPRRATQVQLRVLSTHSLDSGQWTEYDSRLEQIPDDDPYVPPAADPEFGVVSPEGVAPPAPPAGLPGFEANSPARRSPQVRWCQVHDSVRPDLTPKKNAREV